MAAIIEDGNRFFLIKMSNSSQYSLQKLGMAYLSTVTREKEIEI